MKQARPAHIDAQRRATQALVLFCELHRSPDHWMVNLKACLAALEREDLAEALRQYKAVPLGGNGCFNDWWPPVVFEHEDDEYVMAVFDALTSNWSRLMGLGGGKDWKP